MNITVNDILNSIESLAPNHMKMEWDNVGLLCGNRAQAVTKILVSLDPFLNVCQEAVEVGAQLIVTHHALIFRPISAVTDDTEVGRSIMTLCRHCISAINAHTNLDCAPGGVNDTLANTLGLTDISVIDPMGTDAHGTPWGLLRQGTIPTQSMEEFLPHVKSALNCPGLRYVSSGKPVHRVAVGGGSCADGMTDVLRAGCDTFVTSDIKYNQFQQAQTLGINLIDAGHFHTENPVTRILVDHLQAAFPEVEILLSKTASDPTCYL